MLTALVLLNLDNNSLMAIPESFGNLRALKKLSLKNNQLIPESPLTGEQCLPAKFFTETSIETIELQGNVNICQAQVLNFVGVDVFLERRRKGKEKSFQGGALTDMALFGLE